MPETGLLDRVFTRKSPSGAWKMLRDWFLPRSVATQVKRSRAFDNVKMGKGEDPMKFFSRVDKIISTLASLGVPKVGGEMNRKLVGREGRKIRAGGRGKGRDANSSGGGEGGEEKT